MERTAGNLRLGDRRLGTCVTTLRVTAAPFTLCRSDVRAGLLSRLHIDDRSVLFKCGTVLADDVFYYLYIPTFPLTGLVCPRWTGEHTNR